MFNYLTMTEAAKVLDMPLRRITYFLNLSTAYTNGKIYEYYSEFKEGKHYIVAGNRKLLTEEGLTKLKEKNELLLHNKLSVRVRANDGVRKKPRRKINHK